jgi:hypothetical protein
MISPGFPADMPLFTRALAQLGAEVYGIGDQPQAGLDPEVADSLTAYLPVADLWDEDSTVDTVADWLESRHEQVDRVECLWEPGVLLAAKIRTRLGLPGLTVEQAVAFRDKETMKQVRDALKLSYP